IGVWLGNFDAHGVHELTGAEIATPLLFELFNTLNYNSQQHWFFKPKDLQLRFVCTNSGLPMGEHCTQSLLDYSIPSVSATQTCQHLKEYFVASNEAYSYCTSCLPQSGYKIKLYLNITASLADFYDSQHIPYDTPPVHNPMCVRIMEDQHPKIVLPVHNKVYLIEKAVPAEIQLKSIVPSDVTKVYWYINNRFYKEATPKEEVFFLPEEGSTKISCSDDRGRNSTVQITVEFY
ncbi:MAG: penicillin-binding protein 1C, partial [Cytophagales bacterium]|nr:penicillin-binding protein 1C [Cytophaga sp.]